MSLVNSELSVKLSVFKSPTWKAESECLSKSLSLRFSERLSTGIQREKKGETTLIELVQQVSRLLTCSKGTDLFLPLQHTCLSTVHVFSNCYHRRCCSRGGLEGPDLPGTWKVPEESSCEMMGWKQTLRNVILISGLSKGLVGRKTEARRHQGAIAVTQEDHLPKGLGVVVEGRMESGECNSKTSVFACWGCCREAPQRGWQ